MILKDVKCDKSNLGEFLKPLIFNI